MGDGKADDTAAIQKGLDMILPEDSQRKILYFPAGTYRITAALKAVREKHRECQGVGLQGEGPDQSVIVYDGAGNEPMLQWGAWYSTIRGLGFETADSEAVRLRLAPSNLPPPIPASASRDDGKLLARGNSDLGVRGEKSGKPTAGILFGPKFSTMNEVADCRFAGLPVALLGGEGKMAGQAEVCVRRCRFERCETGVLLQNWNSLDWWIWDSRFTECGTALSNEPGCGNFNAYRCVFESSRRADVRVGNVLGAFSLVENESRGSRKFFETRTGHTTGGLFTFQGNRVEWDGREPAIGMGNCGPVLFLDNEFIATTPEQAEAIRFASANRIDPTGNALLIGNTTTRTNLYTAEKNYEVRVIEDGDVSAGIRMKMRIQEGLSVNVNENVNGTQKTEINPSAISDLPSPAKTTRATVVEMEAGAGGDQIQTAIDGAVEGALIHLPAGTYKLTRPIVIQAGRNITIQGDGLLNATRFCPEGDYGKRGLFEVEPGARVEIRDLWLDAPVQPGGAVGLIVRYRDRPGILVHGDQVMTTGWGPGLVVEGMEEGRLVLENHWHNGVTVIGGPRGVKRGREEGRVEILQGMSTRDRGQNPATAIYEVKQGGRIFARDLWFEGDNRTMLRMEDGGTLVLVGGHVAPNKAGGHQSVDSFPLEGEEGEVLLAQLALNGAQIGVGRFGAGYRATLYGLGFYPGTGVYDRLASGREAVYPRALMQLHCRDNHRKMTGSEPLRDINATGELGERFEALRRWRLPTTELTDVSVRLHRVGIWGSVGMVMVGTGLGNSKSDSK